MSDEGLTKKHAPTPKRLDKLRLEGQVLRSRDLMSGLVLILSIFNVFIFSEAIYNRLAGNFQLAFSSIASFNKDTVAYAHILHFICLKTFMILLPIMLMVFFVVLLSPFIYGGWSFTLEVIQFKIYRLNFLTKILKIFSFKQAGIQFIKSLIKILILFSTLAIFFQNNKTVILNLTMMNHWTAIPVSFHIVKNYIVAVCTTLLFIVGFDMLYQHYTFFEKNKMTDQEVKDETRDSEGNPEMKGRVRSAQIAMVRQRIRAVVPQATVIVTNPTHYAVALKYIEGIDPAPIVVAKGKDLLAQHIREVGKKHGIPFYEAPPLARAIYHTCEINDEVDPKLYKAAAIVLFYVNQLRNFKQGLAQAPQMAREIEIPKDFHFD